MKLQNKKGFTLIELLVVITIIGILATGATATYTSQIQKARDTTRVNDIKALQSALEQVFQDIAMYPGKATTIGATTGCNPTNASNTNTSVYCAVSMGFINKLPKDPKSGQSGNNSALEYTYNVGDVDNVVNQAYELSTGVESDGNRTAKAGSGTDSGNDDNRIEFGMPAENLHTCTNAGAACTVAGESISTAIATTTNSCSVLGGHSVVIKGNCQP